MAIPSQIAVFGRAAVLLSPEDVVLCVYLSTNLLAASYEGVELGVGESLIQKAIMEATGPFSLIIILNFLRRARNSASLKDCRLDPHLRFYPSSSSDSLCQLNFLVF